MKITNVATEYLRSEQARGTQRESGKAGGGNAAAQPVAPAPRSDSVQISDAGRALAGGDPVAEGRGSLSAERTAQIRERIMSGAYNSMDVVEQVARRMLSSGDI